MVESKFTLSEERVKRFKKNVREEYDHTSIIKQAVPWRAAEPSEAGQFVQIGMRFPAGPEIFNDSYSTGPTFYSPEIVGVGRSIALGEEKYLVKTLENSILNRFVEQDLSLDAISRAISKVGPSFVPKTVFIPLDFFSILEMGKVSGVRTWYKGPDCFLIIGSRKLRAFWSNKYVPYDSLILVGQRLGKWIVKPDPVDRHWVTIDVEPSDEKVDITAKTVACYSILDPQAGLILKVPPSK